MDSEVFSGLTGLDDESIAAKHQESKASAQIARHHEDVERKLEDLRILDTARKRLAEEKASAGFSAPPIYTQQSLADVIKDVPKYRIKDLVLAMSDTLIVGAHKAGKTTFLLNLIRSLATGEPFLNSFEVTPVEGRILFMNYELPLVLLDEWTSKIGVPEEKLLTLSPSGYSNPLSSEAGREWLVNQMNTNEVEILIVDPFAAATKGLDISEQDNTAVRQWLETSVSDVRAAAPYCSEALITHHQGKDRDKGARGASAFYDWPSSYLELDRKGTQHDSSRYLRANGRDVGVKATELGYNPETHQLSLKRVQEQEFAGLTFRLELMEQIVEVVNAIGRIMTSADVEQALRDKGYSFRKEEIKPAREEAVTRKLITGGLGKFGTSVSPITNTPLADLTFG